MVSLTREQKKKIRELIETYGRVNTERERRIFLEDAGLIILESRLNLNGSAYEFAHDILDIALKTGAPPELGEDATVLLLKHLQDNVKGHKDEFSFVESLLKSSNPNSVSLNFKPVPLFTEERLWQEIQESEIEEDWGNVLYIGGQLLSNVYKIRETRQKMINAYLRRGEYYEKLEKYEEARHEYQNALNISENNHHIYIHLGKNRFKVHDYEQAIIEFSHAIQLNPKAEYYELRAECYSIIVFDRLKSFRRLWYRVSNYIDKYMVEYFVKGANDLSDGVIVSETGFTIHPPNTNAHISLFDFFTENEKKFAKIIGYRWTSVESSTSKEPEIPSRRRTAKDRTPK